MSTNHEVDYLEQINQDVSIMGGTPRHAIEHLDDLHHAVNALTDIQDIQHCPSKRLTTDIAKSAYELLSAGVVFDREYHSRCAEAEPRLLASLDPDFIKDPDQKSPIIIFSNDEPVAVYKRKGSRLLYGLATVPELGIFETCWHRVPDHTLDVTEFDNGTSVFTAPAEQLTSIQPIRFSLFATPVSERQRLIRPSTPHNQVTSLNTTHNDIANQVRQSLVAA